MNKREREWTRMRMENAVFTENNYQRQDVVKNIIMIVR